MILSNFILSTKPCFTGRFLGKRSEEDAEEDYHGAKSNEEVGGAEPARPTRSKARDESEEARRQEFRPGAFKGRGATLGAASTQGEGDEEHEGGQEHFDGQDVGVGQPDFRGEAVEDEDASRDNEDPHGEINDFFEATTNAPCEVTGRATSP